MEDRKLIGFLFIVGGMGVLFLPAFEQGWALALTAYVNNLTGLGSILSAMVVTGGAAVCILLGWIILAWR